MIDDTQNTPQETFLGNTNLETKGLVGRVKGILLSPKTEWAVIAAETPDTGKIMMGYVIPLALLSALCTFLGYGFVWSRYGGVISWGIAYGLLNFISTILAVFISAAVINALAGTFNSRNNFGRALQLVVYAYTPAWIIGILNIFPPLALITWVGLLYSIYLFYLGLPHVMQTPKEKVVGYMVVSAIVLIVVYMVIGAVLTGIILAMFGLGVAAVAAY